MVGLLKSDNPLIDLAGATAGCMQIILQKLRNAAKGYEVEGGGAGNASPSLYTAAKQTEDRSTCDRDKSE